MLHPNAVRIVLNGFVNNYLTETYLSLVLVVIKHSLEYFNIYRLYYNSLVI